MYTLKMTYGYYGDKLEMGTIDIIGIYETWDKAYKAANSKFRAIMECLGDDPYVHLDDIASSPDNHYVVYAYYDPELCRVSREQYYRVSVAKR